MEYVSLLAGEEWSDRPECTHELLAHEARTVNDLLRDSDRSRLVPLIGRLFGTTEDSPELRAHLRLTQARQVVALLDPVGKARVNAVIQRAESHIGPASTEAAVLAAFTEAMQFPLIDGDLDPAHVEFHCHMARLFPFALSPQLSAAEAYAISALVIAHKVAAAGECRADCGSEPARARRMVKELGELIDIYDHVTGRLATDVSDEQIRELADSLG